MREIKFIITKDYKHFKSDIYDHYYIAKNNGYDIKDILESGLFIDKKIHILECYNKKHRDKIKDTKGIWQDVNKFLDDLTNFRILKARDIESKYTYNKYNYSLKEGD